MQTRRFLICPETPEPPASNSIRHRTGRRGDRRKRSFLTDLLALQVLSISGDAKLHASPNCSNTQFRLSYTPCLRFLLLHSVVPRVQYCAVPSIELLLATAETARKKRREACLAHCGIREVLQGCPVGVATLCRNGCVRARARLSVSVCVCVCVCLSVKHYRLFPLVVSFSSSPFVFFRATAAGPRFLLLRLVVLLCTFRPGSGFGASVSRSSTQRFNMKTWQT